MATVYNCKRSLKTRCREFVTSFWGSLQGQQNSQRLLQQSGPGDKGKKKSDTKQHPETAKSDATSRSGSKPNAYQVALHMAAILTATQANEGFGIPPFKAGSSVAEFKALNAKGFVRVSTKDVTKVEGQWIMKESDIDGLTPEQIQSKYSLPNTPDQISDVDIPNGTVIRSGIAGKAFGQNGGGVQYQLKGRASFDNTRTLESAVSTTEGETSNSEAEPQTTPETPIEPIEPEILP